MIVSRRKYRLATRRNCSNKFRGMNVSTLYFEVITTLPYTSNEVIVEEASSALTAYGYLRLYSLLLACTLRLSSSINTNTK